MYNPTHPFLSVHKHLLVHVVGYLISAFRQVTSLIESRSNCFYYPYHLYIDTYLMKYVTVLDRWFYTEAVSYSSNKTCRRLGVKLLTLGLRVLFCSVQCPPSSILLVHQHFVLFNQLY